MEQGPAISENGWNPVSGEFRLKEPLKSIAPTYPPFFVSRQL